MRVTTTPQQFMERVMAWPGHDSPGYVNLHWTKDGRVKGRPYRNVVDFMGMVQWLAVRPDAADDIYYCMTVQRNTGKVFKGTAIALRNRANSSVCRALWLDIDIKTPPKGYATLDDAKLALAQFLVDANLPGPSFIVFTGGGIHVYWIFDTDLSIADWEPFALGLKSEAARLGLHCDLGITADPARVLRVPGTFNRWQRDANDKKQKIKDPAQWRGVAIIHEGPDYPAARFEHLRQLGLPQMRQVTAAVTAAAPDATPPFDLSMFDNYVAPPGLLAALGNPQEDNVADGIASGKDLPLNPDNMIVQCGHFADCAVNKGVGQGQGLWMQTVLASTWLEDGPRWAKEFSKGYPSFDQDELDKMYTRKVADREARNLGYPSCQAFENEGCKHCATCPLKGTIRSPLNLCDKIKPAITAATANFTPAAAAPALGTTADDLLLPPGYGSDKGVIYWIEERTDKDGNPQDPIPHYIFHTPIVGRPWCDAENTLHFCWKNKFHEGECSVPFKVVCSEMTLMSYIGDQGVMVALSKLLGSFMRSWVERIRQAQESEVTAPFGWVEDKDHQVIGFAYGGTLYRHDGTETRAVIKERVLQKDYTPRGDPKKMIHMTEVVCALKEPALQVVSLQPWASPLLYVTGEAATVVWAYSSGGGGGKTTALRTGMALWQHPKRTGENAFTSVSGLEVKMHNLKNLAIIMDEMTAVENLDKMIPALQMVSQGESGQRSRRDRTLAEHPDWMCTLVCGSNQSMHERQLIKVPGSDAPMQRVFEIRVPLLKDIQHKVQYPIDQVGRWRDELNNNFGGVGMLYAKYLAMNRDAIKMRGEAVSKDFVATLKPVGGERFWLAAITTTLLAAELANTIFGKDIYDVPMIKDYLIQRFRDQRKWVDDNVKVAGTQMQAEDILMRFLEAHTNNQLAVKRVVRGAGRVPKAERSMPIIVPAPNSSRGNVVYIRWNTLDELCQIHLPQLKKWVVEELPANTASPNSVVSGLRKSMKATTRENVNLLAGTDLLLSQGRVSVIEIPVPSGSPLRAILEQFIERDDSTTPPVDPGGSTPTGLTAAVTAPIDTGAGEVANALLASGMAQAAKDQALAAQVLGATGPASGT